MFRLLSALTAAVTAGLLFVAGSPAAAATTPGVIVDYGSPSVVKQRPTSIWAAKDVQFTKVAWKRVGATTATASAVMRLNTCTPSCADARYVSQRATLTFRVVSKGRTPYFNCVRADLGTGPVASLWRSKRITLPLSPAAFDGKIRCSV
ncbi:hypothetical protein [Cryptosporangium sp. NPDC048952]|uniref:hypothetical protein n=1 Tax=Cryptosporangium sp. NPDC048952 TaxID=3363961 RepID=UPI00372411DC